MPPSYLLIHRVWLGGIGVLSQLGTEAPFRDELEQWLPGFADPGRDALDVLDRFADLDEVVHGGRGAPPQGTTVEESKPAVARKAAAAKTSNAAEKPAKKPLKTSVAAQKSAKPPKQ
jgi:hypothetical protein